MLLVVFCRDAVELRTYRSVRDIIQGERPDVEVLICNGEPEPSLWPRDDFIHNLFEGFEDFQQAHGKNTDQELTHILARSRCLPVTLYKSDPRFFFDEKSERGLVLEQIYLERKVRSLLQEARPDFVFCGTAGRLVWTIPNLVANDLDIVAYRTCSAKYLNPGGKGFRHRYSRTILDTLSDDPADKMGWPEADVERHVRAVLDGIRSRSYKLDALSRYKGPSWSSSLGLRALLRDFYLAFRYGNGRARARLRSTVNGFLNRRLDTQIDDIPRPFILFPLNTAKEGALLVRAPQHRDIFSACEIVANFLPHGYTLVIREHPAHPGMLDHRRLRTLLKNFPRVQYVSGAQNIHTLLDDADVLITINSTAAFDALVRGIPVITIGETFYKHTGLTYDVDALIDLPNSIAGALVDSKAAEREEMLTKVLSSMLQETYPAPLVFDDVDEDGAIECLAHGLLAKARQYTDVAGLANSSRSGYGATRPKV